MGNTRRLLGLGALVALAGPPIAAAIRKQGARDVGDETSDDVRIGAYFEGREFESEASAFADGEFEAWYAGLDIDLREATLDPAGATIVAKAVFGGIRIVVPSDWRIELHPRAIAGGVTNDTDEGEVLGADAAADGPIVTIEATAIFGGIQITTKADMSWGPAKMSADSQHGNGHHGNGHQADRRAAALKTSETNAAVEAAQETAKDAVKDAKDAVKDAKDAAKGAAKDAAAEAKDAAADASSAIEGVTESAGD